MTRFRLGLLWWLVIIGSLVGLGVIATGSVRPGGYVLAAALGLAGLGRIVLSERVAGALVIRSRGLDAAAFLALACAVALIFTVVKLTPLPA